MATKKQTSDSLDISKAIRMCVDTGKVSLGMSGVKKKVLNGQGKLVILASNVSLDDFADLQKYAKISDMKILKVSEDSRSLGALCGKPFVVSALVVLETGDSPILSFVQ
jgi:large subunit ribosomal protein L30e